MYSSKDQLPKTLAAPREGKKSNIDALVELANLRDDPAAFGRFTRRWPVFARVEEVQEDHSSDNSTYFPTTYTGFPYGEHPTKQPTNIPKKFLLTWQNREALRRIWRGDSDKLTEVLLPTPEEIAMDDSEWASPWNPQLKLDWQRGEFVYIPRGKFQQALYELFRRSAFVKLCANSNCPAPYFIAQKTTQRYCSESCAEVLQRAYKLQWWNEHGSERRRKGSRGKRGKR